MKKEELVSKTNLAISELVYDKTKLRKAYDYYNCVRDKEQFKYLEENYGIGQPTEVSFIPLIKKHVDALVGEYLNVPILPKVSCKDSETINNIYREKQLKISTECYNLLQKNLKNNLLRVLGSQDMVDLNIKEQLDKLIEDINENFISEYEIAGQNIIEYLIQSRNVDLVNKLRQLFIDLLVTGYTFYRVHPSPSNKNIQIECLNPLNVFPDFNYDSPYINESYRIVVRTYLTRNQILNKYGKQLTREDISKIKELWKDHLETSNSFYVRSYTTQYGTPATDGIRAGEEVTPGYPEHHWYRYDNSLIPVYEVEWLETDKDFIMQRYSTVRIGDEIYILNGLDNTALRTKDAPEKTTLSINGVWFNNRGPEPYSMVLNCMTLQDKYDLAIFYRDKLIANSGTVGDWINMPTLPAYLGNSMEERIVKWIAYKKAGIGLVDTSQEGQLNSGQAPLNTIYNGFDDTVKAQAVQAIQMVIDSLEATASSITGVFRERLNGIQQRDAVTNVQVGINNSFVITKQWHFQMDLVTREILLDSLNCAKTVYSKGLTGTIILGNKLQKTFTALPKYFTLTDHDIHIITSSEIIKEMEQIKALVPDLIKSNLVSPDILLDIMTARGLSEMKVTVKKALRKQKQENNILQKQQQQIEELQNALNNSKKQLQTALQKIDQLNQNKLELEKTKIQLENEVKMFEAKTDRTYKENKAENDTKRTEIEYLQLYDGNPYNDKIRQLP